MKTTDIPTRIPVPWAAAATLPYTNPVPIPSQIGLADGAASWTTGFPPLNFVPKNAGGIPPLGRDFNGALNAMSAWLRWAQAGASVPWNAAFSSAVGGYPAGVLVASAVTVGLFWFSTAEDNTTNPDAGGANWIPFSFLPRGARLVTSSATLNLVRGDYAVGLNRTVGVAPMTINLPSDASLGQEFVIEDVVGNLNASPATVFPPSGTITGRVNFVMDEDGQSSVFRRYDAAVWGVSA